MTGFVAVHIGAGSHSKSLQTQYEKLCRAACRKGVEAMRGGGEAAAVAAAAVALLEDSPLTNAGLGSNLNWDGEVECDAALMDGATLASASVAAVSSVKNPVLLAHALLSAQRTPLSLGRVPPCMLVSSGAEKWARENGIATVDPASLITDKARRYYHRYKEKALKGDMDLPKTGLDTVGAVVVDLEGRVAAASSSGGIILKHPGRVGQAGVPGCGSWAGDGVAVSLSGCGEDLLRTSLAARAAASLTDPAHHHHHDQPSLALHDAITSHFLQSAFLGRDSQKLCGVLAVKVEAGGGGGGGELLFAHTTESMGVGYFSTSQRKPQSRISRLPEGVLPGTSVTVEGTGW